MQVVKKTLISLFLLWFSLLLFMPKKELFYTFEHLLLPQGIKINEKSLDSGLFSLTLHDADIYVKGIKIANVNEVSIFTLLFYSRLHLDGLKLDESLRAFVPSDINESIVVHSLLSPTKLFITSMGSFGLAEGVANLRTKKLRINIVDEKELGSLKSQLKKDDKGWYYETSF